MIEEKDVACTIEKILGAFADGDDALYQALADQPIVKKAFELAQQREHEDFYFTLIYPLDRLIDGLLARALPESEPARFIMRNSEFVENQFVKLIERFEGGACSADKSRTIMASLLFSLITGKTIVFDYQQRVTYHLPKVVFTTHEEIMAFFDGIHRLYYGRSDAYVNALAKVLECAKAKEAAVIQQGASNSGAPSAS